MVKTTSSNGFALCIIIVIVIGLFLHFEMGFAKDIGSDIGKKLELFNVGAKNKRHKRHKPWWHPHSWFTHRVYTTHTHPLNINTRANVNVSKKTLFSNYDTDSSGTIDAGEFNNAIDGDLGRKINDNNQYVFTI